jgi:MFS family permease
MSTSNRPPTPVRPSSPSGWRRTTASLASPEFRSVFISNAAFFLAMAGQGIVRPWLAFKLTESTTALGLVSAATAIPMLLLSPVGGVLADRIERRRLILLAQSLAIASEVAVLGLLLAGRLEFWHLVALAGAMGCAFPLIMPARQAIVVNIVGKKGLGAAMALNMGGVNATRVIGPAFAGMLIPVITVEGVYMVNIALYVMALIAMMRVSRLEPSRAGPERSILGSVVEGMHYVWSNRLILTLLAYGLVPMFLAMPFQTLLVKFADDVWETGSVGFGILNTAAGIGAVLGSLVLASRRPDSGQLRLMMTSVIAFGSLLAAFSISPWFLPAVGLVLAANVFVSIFGTLNNTAIQLLIPDSVRGRISSFLMMSFSLPLLGSLPVSIAADYVGAPVAVGVASILAVSAAVVFYLSSRDLRRLDAHVRHAMSQE